MLCVAPLGHASAALPASPPAPLPPGPPQRAGGADGFGQGAAQALVRAPRGFEPVWEDDSTYADMRLVLWRPIPYPGWVGAVSRGEGRGLLAAAAKLRIGLQADFCVECNAGKNWLHTAAFHPPGPQVRRDGVRGHHWHRPAPAQLRQVPAGRRRDAHQPGAHAAVGGAPRAAHHLTCDRWAGLVVSLLLHSLQLILAVHALLTGRTKVHRCFFCVILATHNFPCGCSLGGG